MIGEVIRIAEDRPVSGFIKGLAINRAISTQHRALVKMNEMFVFRQECSDFLNLSRSLHRIYWLTDLGTSHPGIEPLKRALIDVKERILLKW